MPTEIPHPEFESIEDINNYLLQHKEVIDFIKGRGSKPKAAFLMFDERGTYAMDFEQSRFDPRTHLLEYRLAHLFGYRAAIESYEAIQRCRQDILPMRTERGFRGALQRRFGRAGR